MGLISRVIGPELTPEERLRKMEHEHAERMKLIEMGQALPEVVIEQAKAAKVQAGMDAAKSNVRAIFSALGPAGVLGVTTGITAIVVENVDKAHHLVLLIVLWVSSAIVSLGLVAALWFGGHKGIVTRMLQKRLSQAATRSSSRSLALEDDGSEVDMSDLTSDDIEKLARAIQK